MATNVSNQFYGFVDYLHKNHCIEPVALTTALQENESLILTLAKQQLIPGKQLAKFTADYFNLSLFDASELDCEQIPHELIDAKICQQQLFLPIAKNAQQLHIAVVDPGIDAINRLVFLSQLTPQITIIDIQTLYQLLSDIVDERLSDELTDFKLTGNSTPEQHAEVIQQQTPIIHFINKLFHDAIVANASDIHVEPLENNYRIRFRQDGLLRDYQTLSLTIARYCIVRLKVISQLDLAEQRLPQDGRCRHLLDNGQQVDFRINTLPTLWGEKIVLRLLNTASTTRPVDQLGLLPAQQELLLQQLKKPQGLLLVTGPTGSGKTSTLYSALAELNQTEKNISTIEDPIEINLPGINQVAVNHKTGLQFDNALRALLRQDPDIIMLGEIRDHDTAVTAIRAAHTGHLVLSTLHTNNASATINRLQYLGVAAHDLITSVNLIIAQRLIRCLCPHCKHSSQPSAREQQLLANHQLPNNSIYHAQGCHHCHNGYRGRIGIYEMLPMTDSLQQLIITSNNQIELNNYYQQHNIMSLTKAALHCVSTGISDLQEARRVVALD